MSTMKCVGVVMLSETHGVLDGAQMTPSPGAHGGRERSGTALQLLTTVPRPTSARCRLIRWSVVISVEKNHYARHNSVNHRRNADESGPRGENGKGARRDERGREQAEAAEKRNQTSSTRLPRVVAGRPLHGTKIASRQSVCSSFDTLGMSTPDQLLYVA
jgi:hypothetical protein